MRSVASISLACIAGVLMASACSLTSEPGWKRALLTTDASSYTAGEDISVTLFNVSGDEVSFGACPFALERRVNGEWIPVPPASDGDCDSSLYVLDHGRRTTFEFPLHVPEAGTYRLRMSVHPRSTASDASITSRSFYVETFIAHTRSPRDIGDYP